MDKINPTRNRAPSVGSGLTTPPKTSNSFRRSHSAVTVAPRRLRVVLLGVGGVGKTAMAVRFVTKRFIGDYDPNLETIYRHTTSVDDQLVNFEIMDTAGQDENSISLEDKCKWGESFIFIYDVSDRHSFDELTRLKFIASYTHSRLRLNFSPCWILIGNKADLAEQDRMVTKKEGRILQKELGCHIFREISVKESMIDSTKVFEDLWRHFVRISPRSPSCNQRRKLGTKIMNKIPVIDSSTCSYDSESPKQSTPFHSSMNEILVPTITSILKRQLSTSSTGSLNYRKAKQYLTVDRLYSSTRSIKIPENIREDEEEDNDCTVDFSSGFQRLRRNAVVAELCSNKSDSLPSNLQNSDNGPRLSKPIKALGKISDFDQSCFSSSSSINSIVSLPSVSRPLLEEGGRIRSDSDATLSMLTPQSIPENDLQNKAIEHRVKKRSFRKFHKARYTQSFRDNFDPTSGFQKKCSVTGC